MSTVRQILANKKPGFWCLPPEATVLEAVALMDTKDVGAVLVMVGDELVGIVSERDCARKVLLREKSPRSATLREIMTGHLECVGLESTTERCMAIMTERHIRHLPVTAEDAVIGVLSMRDVVRDLVTQQRYTIEQLETYIAGGR